jgi:type IV pilus assembly protein PilV
MAQNDVFEWNAAISRSLASGQGVVCIDNTPNDGEPTAPECDAAGSLYAVKLWWDDDRDDDTDEKRFVTVFQP